MGIGYVLVVKPDDEKAILEKGLSVKETLKLAVKTVLRIKRSLIKKDKSLPDSKAITRKEKKIRNGGKK